VSEGVGAGARETQECGGRAAEHVDIDRRFLNGLLSCERNQIIHQLYQTNQSNQFLNDSDRGVSRQKPSHPATLGIAG
jgi:hypothetical protein